MADTRVLVIEDDEDIRELVRYNLARDRFTVIQAASGEEGIELALSQPPDVILLDLMLPGLDGAEVCKFLRNHAKTRQTPIIMMTAKSSEDDVVSGLNLGADDYITKPFSPRVLVARVRAALRRAPDEMVVDDRPLMRHGLLVDPSRHRVEWQGKPVDLTATEFGLLRFLAGRPGRVYTRQQIVDAVKGHDYPVTDRSVDVQVVGLRRKLGEAGVLVETVRGVGYRFRE